MIIHWIGGVSWPGGRLLAGWPCCCTGRRCFAIAADARRCTRDPKAVTCKSCLRWMAKDPSIAGRAAQGDDLMSAARTVADAHPLVLVALVQVTGRDRGRIVLAGRERREDEHEDIDALPVEERAAVFCSAMASAFAAGSDVLTSDFTELGGAEWEPVLTAAQSMAPLNEVVDGDGEAWAEAECRLRTRGRR